MSAKSKARFTAPTFAEDLQLYRRLLVYVLPYKWIFLASIAGMIVVSAGDASIAMLLQPLIDEGFVGRNLTFIYWIPVVLLLVGFVRAVGTFIDSYCMGWVARQVVFDLRGLMFARLIQAPVRYFDETSSSMMMVRLLGNVEAVAGASTSVIRALVRDAFKAILLLSWMFYLSWKLSLLFLIIIPLAFVVFKLSGNLMRDITERVQLSAAVIIHVINEALRGQRVIKIFRAYAYQNHIFKSANNKHRRLVMKAAVVSAISMPVMVLVSSIGVSGVIWVALQQQLTAGEFSSYLLAMTMAAKPIRSLAQINMAIQSALAGVQTVFENLDIEPEPDNGKVKLTKVTGNVRFDKVSFKYNKADKIVLRDIDIDIEAGATVALVGVSGSGKSTIASLLLRFYSPLSGQISIDGKPLESLTLESLRTHAAIVTQDIVLFDDTIRNNIAYGERDKINNSKLRKAAAAANIMEFTKRMPNGLDTVIGEHGIRLSGGQRQRIAIARALYKDAPLLIMDEATSSLDSHSEQHIQSAIARLIKNRTSLIIAHRLSTIENADQILVLEDGRIVERGTHTELLKRGGAYSNLYRAQKNEEDEEQPKEQPKEQQDEPAEEQQDERQTA